MKKRIISMLLVLCMVLTMLPLSADAVEAEAEHVHGVDCEHTHEAVSREPSEDAADNAAESKRPEQLADQTIDTLSADLTWEAAPSEAAESFHRLDGSETTINRNEKSGLAKLATGYKIYINGTELTSAKTSVNGNSGTASYNASTNTLTLNNFTLNSISNEKKTGIWCQNDVTVELIGTNTITLSGYSGGGMTGLVFMGQATIKKAASASGTPSLEIKATQGSSNYGIGSGDQVTAGTYSLTIQDVNVTISDNSSSKGTMTAIDFAQKLTMSNVKYTMTNCRYGIYASMDAATATLTGVTFGLTAYSTSGINSGVSMMSGACELKSCSGSIKGFYPIESKGSMTLTDTSLTLTANGADDSTAGISSYGTGTLTLSGGKQTIVSNAFGITADDTAKLVFTNNAEADITAGSTGLYIKDNTATVTSSTITITTQKTGIDVHNSSASFTQNSGSITVTGTGSEVVGLETHGTAFLKGGTFTTNSVYNAIANKGTKNVEITGGTQTLNNTYSGYGGSAANKLIIGNSADLTAKGGTYGLYSSASGASITVKDSAKVTINAASGLAVSGALSITGGTTNVTFSDKGLVTAASSANISLTGGVTSFTYSGTGTGYGIYNGGKLTIGGSADVTVTGVGSKARVYGLAALSGTYTLTGGTLNLKSCTIGLYVGTAVTLSGTTLKTSDTDYYGIYPVESTLTLSSGSVTSTNDYVSFYVSAGSKVNFSGATVKATAQTVALYFPTPKTGETVGTYNISGGSLELYGGQAAGNGLYTSLASGYVVKAGTDSDHAEEVAAPNANTFANNKYVHIYKDVKYTLTLENVEGATSASYSAGTSFTYTAKAAPDQQHFKQWELTVNGTTTVIGTGTTITYAMPSSNATLKAVYENCYGGEATCQQKAHCTICGKQYGMYAPHSFTGERQLAAYRCTAGDCQTKATYYRCCRWCGFNSKNTPYESTFEGDNYGPHDFTKQTPTDAYLCTAADCENAATYYYCCSICGLSSEGTEQEATFSYGTAAGSHDFTRQEADDRYLCTAANCQNAATYYYSCSVCGASSQGTAHEATFSYGSVGDHDFTKQTPSADYLCSEANCVSAATYYYCCSGCGLTSEGTAHEATFSYGSPNEDHDFTRQEADDRYLCTAANCQNAATYYYSCSVCGASSQGTAQEATFSYGSPNENHDFTRQDASDAYLCTPADCRNAATYYYSCTRCGASSEGTAQEATFSFGSAATHSFTKQTPTDAYLCSAADCGNAATYYYCCSGCGLTSKGTEHEKTFSYGSPTGSHDFEKKDPSDAYLRTPADCLHQATYYFSCTRCGASTEGTENPTSFYYGPRGDHDFTEQTPTLGYLCTPADCLNAATYYYCCSVCDVSSRQTEYEATFSYGPLGPHGERVQVVSEDHLYTAATCTAPSLYYCSCSLCGANFDGTNGTTFSYFSGGPALRHDPVTDAGRAATCVMPGLTDGSHCARCEEILTEQTEIPVLPHTFSGNGIVLREATCTEVGVEKGICSVCGNLDYNAIPKAAHTESAIAAIPATCDEVGWTEGKKCSVCGEILSAPRGVVPVGHTTVTIPETDTLTAGAKCSVCGKIIVPQQSKSIPSDYWTDDGNYDAALYASEPGNWTISTAAELAAFAKKVNDGNDFKGYTVTLTADIDLGGHIWVPIGNPSQGVLAATFDGAMHKITGMDCRQNAANAQCLVSAGLFGLVLDGAIQNLQVSGNVTVSATSYDIRIGGIVGSFVRSTVRNCSFSGCVSYSDNNTYYSIVYTPKIGGIAGFGSDSLVENCYVRATFSSPNTLSRYTSWYGICGGSDVNTKNCYAEISVGDNVLNSNMAMTRIYGTAHEGKTQNFFLLVNLRLMWGKPTFYVSEAQLSAPTGSGSFANGYGAVVDELNRYLADGTHMNCRGWLLKDGRPTFGTLIVFDQGGYGKGIAAGITENSTVTPPADPEIEGTTFEGWFADEDCTTPFDFSKPISGNTVVYGKYVPQTYSVTYVLNGGKLATDPVVEYTFGVGLTELPTPTNSAIYAFGGWYSDEWMRNKVTSIDKTAFGDITLYARWNKAGRGLTITSDETLVEGTDYTYTGGVLTILTTKPVTIKNTDGVDVTTDRIVVAKPDDASALNANITLAGVNIDMSATGGYDTVNKAHVKGVPALLITGDTDGTVNLVLAEGTENILKGGYMVAALNKNGKKGTLMISGSGYLTAQGGYGGAGIGSESSLGESVVYHASGIVINSGNITAIGGSGAAGIGGGSGGSAYGIEIHGGTITAKCGGDGGVGIGGASGGTAEDIVITGGSVNVIGYGWTDEHTPVNSAGAKVYLITLPNPDGKDIYIDGVKWTPSNHTALDSTDTNLYAYISGEKHVIKIGSDEAVWHFDTATQAFLKTNCVDNVKDHFCDYCGDKLSDHTGGQATCTEKAVCTYCGRPYGDEPNHSYAPCAAKAATCTEKGWEAYELCSVCGYKKGYRELPALGHDEQPHEAKDATCTEKGWNAYVTCSRCDYTTYQEIPALGHDEQPHEAKDATCTEKGWEAYETCTRCDHSTYKEIPALGHDPVSHDGQAATCTEKGWEAYETCTRCDHSTYKEIPALGHDYAETVVPPTCTEDGYTDHICSRCDHSYQTDATSALGHHYENGKCTRCDAVEPTCPTERFTDLADAWYHEAIDYVIGNGLMQGISGSKFAPRGAMSRAMMIVVLYRMAGSPAVEASSTFVDVAKDQWYADAVAWAQAEGIIMGVSESRFAPDMAVTREQIATILWRYAGKPTPEGTAADFQDADTINVWAKEAVQWATEEGLFVGYGSGLLKPHQAATRAEFATIIMRYFGGSYVCPKQG